MTIRRVLIFAPLVLIIFLLQSYLWVPTYEQQTKGNLQRLNEYIAGSIGDASMLNPILSSDTSSSEIESHVFEGLIDRDENLNFRGRLAASWEIFEEAYFYINKDAQLSGNGALNAEKVVELIREAKVKTPQSDEAVSRTLENIQGIEVLPAHSFLSKLPAKLPAKLPGIPIKPGEKSKEAEITVNAPERIKLRLKKVDQALFDNLESILGQEYFSSFKHEKYIVSKDSEIDRKSLSLYSNRILPVTEHNPVIIFHLRPDVKFHDGHTFDAGDVKFTYESIIDPKNLSPRVPDYEPVKSVDVIDPLTVRITYKRLYSPAFGTWAMGVLPEHLLNDKQLEKEAVSKGKDPANFSMRQSSFSRNPIGCGPFVFKEWKSDQKIVLDRFEDYWEGRPNYHRYIYRIVPDLLTQEMEFYAGTVDSYGVQPHQVQRLKNDPEYQSFSGLSFGYTYIGYNMRREPFNDKRVRRALGMAIDVEKIIKYVLYGQAEPITGPFVKQTDYYNRSIKPLPYDPAQAQKLLAEAGWQRNKEGWLEKDGKRLQFTLITNSGNDLRKAVLAIAQDAWRQIGIDVSTDLIEWSVFLQERVDKADFDALVLGWSMGIEPDLYQIWHSSQTNQNQLNFVAFKNKEADDLIIKIRQEYDHDKQVQYCHRLHEIIADEQPYNFLYVSKWTAVLDKRIVIKEPDQEGEGSIKKITPTKTGSYTFYFNKWIKLPQAPDFEAEG